MASNNSSFFSNGFPSDNLTFGGNLYKVSASPEFPLGFRVGRGDGNVYRYGQFSTTTAAGLLVSPQATLYAYGSNCLAVGSAATDVAGQPVQSVGTSGSRWLQSVIPTSPTVVKNCFAGGYFLIQAGTGSSAATAYRIKGNTASGTPTTSNFYIELYEPLQASCDATTDYQIITCPYSNLLIYTDGAHAATAPVGVSVAQQTVTTYEYGFVQTWGVASVLMDAHTVLAGEWLQGSLLTAGCVGPYLGQSIGSVSGSSSVASPIIGYQLKTGVASVNNPVYLTISR